MIRGFIALALLAGALPAAPVATARAEVVAPVTVAHWTITTQRITWHAATRVPVGDAAVEFWAGGRLLGRPAASRDRRSFTLRQPVRAAALSGLQVRAGGRRIDLAPPAARTTTPAPAPARRGPFSAVDPGLPGPYLTISGEYRLPDVRLPGLPEPVEMRGVVVAPAGAHGPRPLVLFLHGRHATCGSGVDETIDWPCPPGVAPVASFRGYLYAQRLLASQGYLTVSIAANGVNGQDESLADSGAAARSALVRLHLAHWADWSGPGRASAPPIVREAPPADLSRVLLVGHSRGGEGVEQAATDSATPPPGARIRWTIRGTVLVGPTSYNQDPAPDVPSVTVLPGCDGDVADLAGQVYVDGTRGVSRGVALHSAVYLAGANHDYFSTAWTDDDFAAHDDPICSRGTPTRLSPQQQRVAGQVYVAAAARLFLRGDDRVRELLDGSGVRARSAGDVTVWTEALGAGRRPLVTPDRTLHVGGGARLCAQVSTDPAAACLAPDDATAVSPHFRPLDPITSEDGRYALALTWTHPGRTMTMRPARAMPVTGATALALRIIVPPNSTGTRLGVTLTDRAGRHADLGDITVDGLPGTANMAAYWAQEVRVPLAAAHGLDLAHVTALRLTSRSGPGRAWLLDAWGWRPGSPVVRPVALPRVDVGLRTVPEGDPGTHTAGVPVTVTGSGTGRIRLWTADGVAHLITVRPGERSILLPSTWTGDHRWGGDDVRAVVAKAVQGAVVGSSRGGLTIRDDDPEPAVVVTPLATRVTQGHPLTWRIHLTRPAERPVTVAFWFRPLARGEELSTADVDPAWLRAHADAEPIPAQPLSAVRLRLQVTLDAATGSAILEIPTIAGRHPAPEGRVSLIAQGRDLPGSPTLSGTVGR